MQYNLATLLTTNPVRPSDVENKSSAVSSESGCAILMYKIHAYIETMHAGQPFLQSAAILHSLYTE